MLDSLKYYPSIKKKLITVVSLSIGAIGIFIVLFFPYRYKNQAYAGIEKEIISVAEILAQNVSTGLAFQDVGSVLEIFQSVQNDKELAYIILLDANGEEFAPYNRENYLSIYRDLDQLNAKEIITGKSHIFEKDRILNYETDIYYNQVFSGKLRIGFSLDSLYEEVIANYQITLLVTLFVLGFGMIITNHFASILIIQPIIKLSQASEEFTHGNLDFEITITADDEIGQLSNTFNQMRESLKNKLIELSALNSELKLRNKELQEFVYIASHDLQSPLVSIQGFLPRIYKKVKTVVTEKEQHYFNRIHANVEKMHDLIQSLLDLSRVNTQKFPVEEIDVEQLLQEDILLTFQTQFEEIGASWVLKGTFPKVYCEKVRLRQIFSNFISNAIKYRDDKRKLEIEIGYQNTEKGAIFHVRDNGIGIDETYYDLVFKPMQRLEDIETDGTGIGLAIVKKIVENYGCKVWLQSKVNEGSTFFFTLPINNHHSN